MEFIYEWMRSLSYYMILMTAIVHVIPSKEYQKYIQFYMGLLIVLILATPIVKLLGMEELLFTRFQENTYAIELKELERQTEYLREVELDEFLSIEEFD